jgi:ABC-type transporter Mla subunit MlaD
MADRGKDMMICFRADLLRQHLRDVMQQMREAASMLDRLYDSHAQARGPLRDGLVEAINDLGVARELLQPYLEGAERCSPPSPPERKRLSKAQRRATEAIAEAMREIASDSGGNASEPKQVLH